ncbi:hypothetical protein ACICHK_00455 [Streptomyces sp. AHU1]|uniref:hypothetical protein n=1 Tax=Streptomyces sp. AHU1 TaxID=3377215 RepID=UPI0038780605
MSSPLGDSLDDGLPPYEAPAWYTDPLTAGGPDSNVPWHTAGAAPAPEPGCHVCQARPAAPADIRSHTGMIFWGQTRTVPGPFCRQCGIALVRTMTTRTLWQGWWGLLSLLVHTPLTLARNAHAYRKFRQLPVSTPPAGRDSIVPGKPVLRRPQAYVALVPLVWAALLITQIARG